MDRPSVSQPETPEIRYLYGLRRGSTRLGLAAVRRLLRSLGSPETAAPVVHVAGTNGKGSTTAFAAAMLQSGGARVGRFTSPHLLRVEERIAVDGVPIDAATFAARVRDLRRSIDRAGASFFEAMTALAAVHFRDAGVDVAVYEVGLGGRLDATNALPAHVSLLTSIGHDHEAILGRGLRAVCQEKLGIVRRGTPLYAALERPDLVALARAHCRSRGAPFARVPADIGRVLDLDAERGMRFELRLPDRREFTTRMLGAHQVRNAALAALGVLELHRRGHLRQAPDLERGAALTHVAGRFQILPREGSEPLVVLDVGHNPEALAATLDLFEAVFPAVRPHVVLGLLADKRPGPVWPRLLRRARSLVLTVPAVDRAWDPWRVLPRLRALPGAPRIACVPRVADAVQRTLDTARAPVLIVGSHFLVAEAMTAIAARRRTRPENLVAAVREPSGAVL